LVKLTILKIKKMFTFFWLVCFGLIREQWFQLSFFVLFLLDVLDNEKHPNNLHLKITFNTFWHKKGFLWNI